MSQQSNKFSRRGFLQFGMGISAYATVQNLLGAVPAFAQDSTSSVLRKLVWINMGGGWDILETVDPKSASTSGIDVVYDWGLANPIASGSDVKVGRWMPGLGAIGSDAVLVRGLVMGTTSHDAGSTYMDTGILSNNGRVNAASIPAIVASESGATIPLIQLQGGSTPQLDRGLLKPVSLVRAQNLDLYRQMYPAEEALVAQRIKILDYLKNSVTRVQAITGTNDRLTALASAESKIRGQITDGIGAKLQLSNSDLSPFQSAAAAAGATMGRGGIDNAFALALKLVKNDLVTCVNMGIGGFDTHSNQDRQLEPLLRGFDRGLKVFVDELRAAGKLDTTLIVLYSDFGRTPKVNNTNGRDHWPVGGAVMIGGGIAGGRAVGGTDGNMLAQSIDKVTGLVDSAGEQINPTHLGGSVLELTLGAAYLDRRQYLTSIPALTRLKS